ncbi:glycosyltransferase family 4 protein [Sabulicella glaciei]|uniref:Glycosyltransferase family 4 protein n=1 Tax=Sabulicella glaciei TaxID=2984948 RepID=A0ABT3NQQ3_9PROT|nr:glycosyltransferase family 4 protein [Roseococcus sp. MDT2-1-1]MCW8084493.1 glycosyltransferase family 4 protein [Roseococcus sp. MDT2-1-1]
MAVPPTILQVLPALDSGGVERGAVEIAEAIAAAGWRPLVASEGGRLAEGLGEAHVTLPLAAKAPWAIWRNARRLAEVARKEGVSLIHARSRAPAWAALGAARRLGVPFVTTYHGTYNEGFPGKRFYNSVMASGDRIIAISRFIAEHLIRIHGIHPDRVRLIPRGVDPARFDPGTVPAARVMAMRAGWRVPEGAKLLLLPARLSRWKGQEVLVDALVHLPEAHAVLAGDAQGRQGLVASLLERAAALGVAERLHVAGHVTDMPAALAAADVVIHASTEPEAFGRTVIEAQAMARPVIAADLGGPRETVRHGATGWLVPPGDPAALAQAVREVLALPPAARAAIGAAARAGVPTLAAMQEATLAVYRELLPGR